MTEETIGKIQAQILWDRLLAVVEEQAQTLVRTAFSTTVREAGDLSAGVFDRHGRMLAQAVTGTPGHVNAMAASVGFFLEKFPLDSLQPGDVLLTNDPWYGTGHLNDFTVVTPVFRGGHAIALFASTSHIADVGGLGFGPDAQQVFEEGINIPMGYLFRAGEVNETLLEILRVIACSPRSMNSVCRTWTPSAARSSKIPAGRCSRKSASYRSAAGPTACASTAMTKR
jgi:N-methylhydantoinase B